jgi:SNF2 family DNA or RNA helicase
MLAKIQSYFRKYEISNLSIEFKMEQNNRGKFEYRVVRSEDGHQYTAKELSSLMEYGYKDEWETKTAKHIAKLSDSDRQILLALKSLNPKISLEGIITTNIEPNILEFFRQKPTVTEGERSKKIIVSENLLCPEIVVDYDKQKGLRIEKGYRLNEGDELISENNLKKTKSKKYAINNNTFYPIKQLNNEAKNFFQKPNEVIPIKDIPEFLVRDLLLLKGDFKIVLTDLVKDIKVISDRVQPKVTVNRVKGGWLEFNVSYDIEKLNKSLIHEILYKQKDSKYYQVDEMTWIELDTKTIEKTEKQLQKIEADITENGYRIPVSEFTSIEELIQNLGGNATLSKAYKEFIANLTKFNADRNFKLSKSAEECLTNQGITLRPYQREGIHWLNWLRETYLQGILADDMGLGKTMQSLLVLRNGYEVTTNQNHSLIVAPKSVLIHWNREIERVFPEANTIIFHGSNRSTSIFKTKLPLIIITTYEIVLRDINYFSKVPFFYVILDEATKIKNPDARRSQAIKSINSVHRLALSGTPVENRPAELWSIYDFLMRGHLGKYGSFTKRYENTIMAGNKDTANQLGKRIKPFLLRRLKENVAKDLPEKIIISEWCSLSEEQKALYGGLQDEVKKVRKNLISGEKINYTMSILPLLTKLKQICDHPSIVTKETNPILNRSEKFDWIINKLTEITENEEKVVVFSHFLDMLTLIEKILREKQIRYIRIDGGTNNRQTLIDDFNLGDAQVALLSIMATGYGINMTSANHVIHADRWWNPAIEDQATDRVHRIGQQKSVYVYHILNEKTIEERIDLLLSSKRRMAKEIIDAANNGSQNWSKDELLEILKPFE